MAAGGVSGAAGAAGTPVGAGGSATGGAAGVGGSTAGTSGGTAGAGGSAAGAGGSAAGAGGSAAGAGGSGDAPMPSTGCALAIPKPATLSETSGFEVTRKFPTTYDGVTPMPLIVALHATNYSANNMAAMLLNGQPAAERYVIVAPSAGSPSLMTFEDVPITKVASFLGDTLAELCVDQRRIFGAGNGSGGRVVIKLADQIMRSGSPAGVRFRAMGVVGTYYGGGLNPYPTIFIHPLSSLNSRGVAQDEDGTKALQLLLTRNACGGSSAPVSVAGCASIPLVNPSCVDFDECSAPLRWCHHNENTTVGDPWPCFATAAIYQFFEPYLGGVRGP